MASEVAAAAPSSGWASTKAFLDAHFQDGEESLGRAGPLLQELIATDADLQKKVCSPFLHPLPTCSRLLRTRMHSAACAPMLNAEC